MDVDHWMTQAVAALGLEFDERLLVVGLQGSMRRGEATPASDIDILIVLDELTAADLDRCRMVLRTLPEGHRAHGFTCGKAELAGWPRSEIFAFAHDVRTYHGDLGPLLPAVRRRDIEEGARLAVGGLYHAVAHQMVSDPGSRAPGEGLRKMLFYAMLQIVYVRSGSYAATRAELLDLLDDDESSLLMSAEESFLAGALEWAGRQLRGHW